MKVLLCTFASLLTMVNAHSQWSSTTLPAGGTTISCFAETGTSLFVGSGLSVFRSTNNGASWNATGGVAAPGIRALLGVGAATFCGTLVDATNGGVFRSTDAGVSWPQVYNPPGSVNAPAVLALAVSTSGTTIFAGTDVGPAGTIVARSTNNGTNWVNSVTGLPTFAAIEALQSSGGNIFAATSANRSIYKSTNDGINWTPSASGVLGFIRRFYASGSNLYAISDSGIFVTTNTGTNWTAVSSAGLGTVAALAISGQNMFAGSTTGGVFRSTNSGASWTSINTGLTELTVRTFGIVGSAYLLAGTATLVWRRPLSEVTTGVSEFSSESPNEILLRQNYPNPFNPSTTFTFEIQNSNYVSLKVFNVLGQEVATLVNEELKAGSYQRTLDAKNLASGVYFYRLVAGENVATKKMMMMK